jgi:GNAT superfamily N-acetyltransferase
VVRYISFFYRWVGEPWQWFDKRDWPIERWNEHAKKSALWIIYHDETPVGYFELAKLDASVELQYFGLALEGIGLGIGGYALEVACREALKLGDRVTVNTCSLDHPAALDNYKKCGFKELRREIE